MIGRCLLLMMFAKLLLGDGGTVVFHKPAGDFDVTVFSKSEAVRAGLNDLSVMVQQRSDNSAVMNATVLLHLQRNQSGQITRLTAICRHDKATNKLLYAASVNIPSTGTWSLEADVASGGRNASAYGSIDVFAPLPPVVNYWPYVAMVPALAVAFIINRKLRARFRSRAK
jgi:hypothetical protein